MSDDGKRSSTVARYTLGSPAPWLVDDPENKTTDDTTYMQTDFYGRDTRILVGTGNILPLFKSGIRQLRDHRPLLLHPAMPASIEINNRGQRIALKRETPGSPWKITYPLSLDTDPAMMDVLLGTLQKLTAVRVYNPEETSVPDMTDDQITSVSIRNFTGRLSEDGKSLQMEEQPVTLRIYPPPTTEACPNWSRPPFPTARPSLNWLKRRKPTRKFPAYAIFRWIWAFCVPSN